MLTPEVERAVVLTSYAWEARYPGFSEPVSEDELQDAIRHAQTVIRWAEKVIS